MWRRARASAKLAATLVVVGIITVVSLGTVGCRPTLEGNVAVDQSPPPHSVSTSTEASDGPFLALTRDTFDELVLNTNKLVVVIFTSRKCGVCKKVEGQMVELAN